MIITFDNASFSYGDNLIFHDVSFALNEGERVGLIGANGEGKPRLSALSRANCFPKADKS